MSAPADNEGDGVEESKVDRYFYVALSEPRSSTDSAPRACVYRTGSLQVPLPGAPPQDHAQFLRLACAPNTDAEGRRLRSSSAQALTVAQAVIGAGAGPRVEVPLPWRKQRLELQRLSQEVMTLQHRIYPADTPTPAINHLSAADAPWDVGSWGLYSSIMVYEKCDQANASCPNDTLFTPAADTRFAGAWTDTARTPTTVNDMRVRAFEWE